MRITLHRRKQKPLEALSNCEGAEFQINEMASSFVCFAGYEPDLFGHPATVLSKKNDKKRKNLPHHRTG